jgi:hypothetical protein
MTSQREWRDLIAYSLNVLRQGAGLIDLCIRQGVVLADVVGPHLRHVVEHYEAFVMAVAVPGVPGSGAVHYDARPRDARFQRDARFALQRIAALQVALLALDRRSMPDLLSLHLLGGLNGEREFVSRSSPERELMFLASHAIHHYALVKARLEEQGVTTQAQLGLAPSTVRHQAVHAS